MLRQRSVRNRGGINDEKSELEDASTSVADDQTLDLSSTAESEKENLDDDDDEIDTVDPQETSFFRLNLRYILMGVFCRIAAVILLHNFLVSQPEWVSPLVSLKVLRDGVILEREGFSKDSGDMVHMLPMIIFIFNHIFDATSFITMVILNISLDIATAYLLGSSALKISRNVSIAQTVVKCILLNPLAIGSCACLNLTTLYNMLLAAVVFHFGQGNSGASSFILGISSGFQLFPITLFASVWLKFTEWADRRRALLGFSMGLLLFLLLNYVLADYDWSRVYKTYDFLINYQDLKPNCGLFWYFYQQVFEHFRTFYEYVFLANAFLYVLPLTLTLRSDPILHLTLSLLLLVALSPYPTLGDSIIYMALLPLQRRHFKTLRYSLLVTCTIVTCICLMPVMWHMWVYSGSGNANFYFAVTLIYNVAQLYILLDLLMAHFREEVTRIIPEAISDKTNFVLN